MRGTTKRKLENALTQIDAYFLETVESHYSDSGTMWELAMKARGAIAEALATEGASVSDAPWTNA